MIFSIFASLFLIFFASLSARSISSFSRHELEVFCHRRGQESRLMTMLREYDRVSISVNVFRLIGMLVLIYSSVFIFGQFNVETAEMTPVLVMQLALFGIATGTVLLAVDVWFPSAISKLWNTQITYYTWSFWYFMAFFVYPIYWIDWFVHIFFERLAGQSGIADEEEAFEDEIRTIVTEGHRGGLLEGEAREMIESVMELSDVTVSEIMTPRTDMICISSELTWDEMLREVIGSAHSRMPVYKENRDDIIGIIHTKDLLRVLATTTSDDRPSWTSFMKEPLFVPETKPVDRLLQEFQNSRLDNHVKEEGSTRRIRGHIAIVLDEYGGVSGIVTLEDILEEIVGEIHDEHETVLETEDIHKIGPETFEVLGRVRIDELNKALDLDLSDDEDYDTIAGFIFSTLGHIPKIGERVDYEKDVHRVSFTVIEATLRRIEKIRVERH
ncbi:MAG: hemolysin family protein [Thermoguttaceae bacterium]